MRTFLFITLLAVMLSFPSVSRSKIMRDVKSVYLTSQDKYALLYKTDESYDWDGLKNYSDQTIKEASVWTVVDYFRIETKAYYNILERRDSILTKAHQECLKISETTILDTVSTAKQDYYSWKGFFPREIEIHDVLVAFRSNPNHIMIYQTKIYSYPVSADMLIFLVMCIGLLPIYIFEESLYFTSSLSYYVCILVAFTYVFNLSTSYETVAFVLIIEILAIFIKRNANKIKKEDSENEGKPILPNKKYIITKNILIIGQVILIILLILYLFALL